MTDYEKLTLAPQGPAYIAMQSNTGRELFRINADGTVGGNLEDAGEAAAAFVASLRGIFDAEREALDLIRLWAAAEQAEAAAPESSSIISVEAAMRELAAAHPA